MNEIICGDSTLVLKKFQNETFDLVVTSPPYDAIRDYKDKNQILDLHSIGLELFRVLKDGGICAVVLNDGTKNFRKSLTTFRTVIDWCDNIGFGLFECIIYQKNGRPGAWWTKRFRVDHEYILLFLKGKKPKYFDKESLKISNNSFGATMHGTTRSTDGKLTPVLKKIVLNKTKCRGTVWFYNVSSAEKNKLKQNHPATFPDKMAQDLIVCFSAEKDLILDPFCGSGTTCVMAKRMNRNFIGVDIAEEYCNIAKERLMKETNDA